MGAARKDISAAAHPGRKAGRPAQAGERYPSGELKRGEKRDTGSPPTQIKRLFDKALRGAADPRFGTVLGLLFMERKITARQYAASEAYAKLRARFDSATQVPRRSARSPSYGEARAEMVHEEMSQDAYTALTRRHARMLEELSRHRAILERACIDDAYMSEPDQRALRPALDAAADFFGIQN